MVPTSYQAPLRRDASPQATSSQSLQTNLSSETATVRMLIAGKGRDVYAVRPQDTISNAVRQLRDKRIGALVVTDANGSLQGILSERDIVRQLAETPDGVRYINLARDVSKPGGSFGAPVRRFAIALGCEVRHADKLVYADSLDVTKASAFEPIGISCRICERTDCHQRSVPPLEKRLSIHPERRDVLPYSLE